MMQCRIGIKLSKMIKLKDIITEQRVEILKKIQRGVKGLWLVKNSDKIFFAHESYIMFLTDYNEVEISKYIK